MVYQLFFPLDLYANLPLLIGGLVDNANLLARIDYDTVAPPEFQGVDASSRRRDERAGEKWCSSAACKTAGSVRAILGWAAVP